MENDMMNPNMMPNQMGVQPQMDIGGQMPAADPSQIQAEIDALSGQEKQEAKQAMDQILQIIEQMKAQGASEEEIEQFLQQIGISLEELQFAEQLLVGGGQELGLNMM